MTTPTDDDREAAKQFFTPDEFGYDSLCSVLAAHRLLGQRQGIEAKSWQDIATAPMTDIVERLRHLTLDTGWLTGDEAADLIEALRQEVKALHTAGHKLGYYAGHADDCEDVTGEYAGSCSCGYRAAWQQWRLALGDKL